MENMKFCRIVALILAIMMVGVVFASCKETPQVEDPSDETTGNPEETTTEGTTDPEEESSTADDPDAVKITITSDVSTLEKVGDSATLTVTVENTDNKEYTLTAEPADLVTFDGNKVTYTGETKVDKIVTITATAKADENAKAKKSLILKAPVIEGQVGELTSELIAALGNSSITVKGELIDVYDDYKDAANSTQNKYGMEVYMEDGMWKGVWWHDDNTYSAVTDIYVRGEQDGITGMNGAVGHAVEKVFINKDNQVDKVAEKNYLSEISIWESQHLWNHLANLDVNKFEYDVENERYIYKPNLEDMDELYFLTYLSYSLTPMLSDTIVGLYLEVKDGQITGLGAETEKLLYGDDTQNDPEASSYTTIKVTFSDIGTTKVEMPKPYTLTEENGDLLKQAIEAMQGVKNYTFSVKDNMYSQPAGDEGDYVMSTLVKYSVLSYGNTVTATGTVGSVGYITEDAYIYSETMKYSYSMDGKDYSTSYFGYKQMNDTYYDEFKWSSADNGFVGTKRVDGNFQDKLPGFDFSPELFEFLYAKAQPNGTKHYVFQLRESAVTRDIALEISAYKYADDAAASIATPLTLTVSEDGRLVGSEYPYDLVDGTYLGTCTTTYSNIGTTTLEEDAFDNYIPRELKGEWSQYTLTDYYYTHSTLQPDQPTSSTASADKVLSDIFGDSAAIVPAPSVFIKVFGDNISGPWFDWSEKGVDAEGNTIYSDMLDITAQSTVYDENMRVLNYDEIIESLKTELGKLGYTYSPANSGISGGDRYTTFVNGDVTIRVENNYTRFFWITILKTGTWSLEK